VRRVIVIAAGVGLLAGLAAPAYALGPGPSSVAAENALPGSTDWQRQQAQPGAAEIFGTQITAAPGDTVDLHVSTAYRYRIVVYRLGWYGGTGARQVACIPTCTTDEQGTLQPPPGPPPTADAPPIRAGWPVTDELRTDPAWTSGYYLVEALLTSGSYAGRVATTFVVLRQPTGSRPSQILVQVPVNTWEAYNSWGGRSLYSFTGPRMYRVSFERPFGFLAQNPFWWEIQLVRFLEREGYDISYQTDIDTDGDPASLLRHRLVIDAGHDEYWTRAMRDGFATALAAGTNLAFVGSNDAYWHVEYQDGGQTIYAYKSMYDPNPVLANKTAMWRDIGEPECMLMGVENQSVARLTHSLDYSVTPAGAADPWVQGTGLNGGSAIVGVVGREHDVLNPYPQSCYHDGLVDLFHYTGAPADQNADAVRFTAPSGARVFASGAQAFSWALDGWRSDGTVAPAVEVTSDTAAPADPRVQQFMRNALDDLTRPAAPQQLAATRTGQLLNVAFAPDPDPRVLRIVVGIRDGAVWRPLCSGVLGCTGRMPKASGPIVLGAVAVDTWGRRSAAAYAVATGR
jgi:hypothetical protein